MKVQFNDAAVWDMIKNGDTKGVFQCESKLVQEWLRKIKPDNLWELSAVIALVRPGALKSGMASDYEYNKQYPEQMKEFGHPVVNEVFKTTNGVLCFQESMMSLGAKLAWPDLEENKKLLQVDILRKAVGKKNQQKILEIGNEFVEGCLRNGVDKETADRVFEIIKNCGRYLFNLSHSMAYAHIAYKTAWFKYHYPLQFFATYFSHAKEKPRPEEEIMSLYRDCQRLGIKLLSPDINVGNIDFKIEPDDSIRYGLRYVKHVRTKSVKNLETYGKIIGLKNTLIYLIDECDSKSAESLICVGAFESATKVGRKNLLNIYNTINKLTPKWQKVFMDTFSGDSVKDVKSHLIGMSNEMKNPQNLKIRSLAQLLEDEKDSLNWIELIEKKIIYIPISATRLDGYESLHYCSDCHGDLPPYATREIAVVISKIYTTKTKKGKNPGQNMAILTVYDSTGELEIPVFPEAYEKFHNSLELELPIKLVIKKMKSGGWAIEEIYGYSHGND